MLYGLRDLKGNIWSIMTKHMGVHRRLHRFAYLIGKVFYAINHNLLVLFGRFILVPCHSTRDKHWKYIAPADPTSEAFCMVAGK